MSHFQCENSDAQKARAGPRQTNTANNIQLRTIVSTTLNNY